jgi:hypothetical protein
VARIILARDALKDRIDEIWTDRGDPDNDEVLAPWSYRIDSKALTGRKVLVFPTTYAGVPVTRDEDQDDYGFVLLVVERYTEQGDPPDAWVDERVDFCEQLLEAVGNPRLFRLLAEEGDPDSGLWPQEAGVNPVYDVEELQERKLFMSALEITYREHAE